MVKINVKLNLLRCKFHTCICVMNKNYAIIQCLKITEICKNIKDYLIQESFIYSSKFFVTQI